jgi:hypothetical protein
VAEALGEETLSAGVALRDTTGRLCFFADSELDETAVKTLSDRLRLALGPYARSDRVAAGADAYGVTPILADPAALTVTAGAYRVRLLDRRLVGADWLRAPFPAAPPPPRFVFASLKGGVGRSTALAVTAADLAARGLRVLTIDLDLEAPGLGPMLLDEGTLPEFGVLDALVENGLAPLDATFLTDLVGPSGLAGGRGRIDVIPVLGRRSLSHPADVLAKIARAYVEDIGPEGQVTTLLDQIRALVDAFADPHRYDAILVDARAGLHETTAAALLGLGAEVFLFGLDEPQTYQGFEVLLSHLARFVDRAQGAPEWLDRLTLVQGKMQKTLDAAAFAERCRTLFTDVGLGPAPLRVDPELPVVGAFSDIPWDDTAPDAAVLPDEDWQPRIPLAVADDPRFRGFDPQARQDLLVERVYRPAFGQLLDQIHDTLPITIPVDSDSVLAGAPSIGVGSLRRSDAEPPENEDVG